jgi:hypothetical protein
MILNGKAYELHTTPLEGYFERVNWRPTFLRRSSANWRGYEARWELFGERLFLTGLFGMEWVIPPDLMGKLAPDPDPFEPSREGVKTLRLPDLFPDRAPLVFAEWVTERLVVATGPLLIYVHAGFASLHATYRTMDVAEGRVRAVRDWNAREWAQEMGRDWLIERLDKMDTTVADARNSRPEEVEVGKTWRDEKEPNRDWICYRADQRRALQQPCGQTPLE